MWSTLDKELSSIRDNLDMSKKVPTFNDIMSGYRKLYFIRGPGLLIDINQRTKDIYPTCFGGVSLMVNKAINDEMSYNINLNLDKGELKYYKPYCAYIGRESKKYDYELNRVGFSNFVLQHDFSKEMKCTILGHVQHMGAGSVEGIMDYYGQNYTGSVSLSNVDLSSGELSAHFLREVDLKTAIGTELAVKIGSSKQLELSRLNLVGRYRDVVKRSIVSGSVGLQGVQVCFYKQHNMKFCFGSIVDYCFETKKPTASVACQLTEKEITLRTCVDTNGMAGVNVSRNIFKDNTANINITLSGLTNFSNIFKFGIGLDLTM